MDDIGEFVSFGIDPGDEAGWAVATCPEIPSFIGTAKTPDERVAACEYVYDFAADRPIIVVIEDWTAGGPHASHNMFKSLGKSSGRWLEQIESVLGIEEKYVLRVVPQRWRNDLFTPKMVKAHSGGSRLKRLACAYLSPPGANPVRDHNSAEAGCIACWVHCSEEGMEAAEKAFRRCAKMEKQVK